MAFLSFNFLLLHKTPRLIWLYWHLFWWSGFRYCSSHEDCSVWLYNVFRDLVIQGLRAIDAYSHSLHLRKKKHWKLLFSSDAHVLSMLAADFSVLLRKPNQRKNKTWGWMFKNRQFRLCTTASNQTFYVVLLPKWRAFKGVSYLGKDVQSNH